MKISNLHRVRQLEGERSALREKITHLQRFVAGSKERREAVKRASSKNSKDALPEEMPEYSEAKIEISARYKDHSVRAVAVQEAFGEEWLEAAEVILSRRIEKIEAEMRELGVEL